MEFNKLYFGYDPEKDANRPIRFMLSRDWKDWYYAYWRFADEDEKLAELNKSTGFINKFINFFKRIRVSTSCSHWHKLMWFISPYSPTDSESEGWMQASWEMTRNSSVESQLNYLNHTYPTIKDLHRWIQQELGKSQSFLKWKDEYYSRRNSMKDSYE